MRMPQIVAWIVVIAATAGIANAGGTTVFTYQARLLDGGEPANGPHDFEFSLWDAQVGGNQIGATQILNGVPVADGLFTVQIDFGADAFDNTDRSLEVTVNGVPLLPRQPITRAPYSIQTRGIFVDQDQNVGIGTTNPTRQLHIFKSGLNPTLALETDSSAQATVFLQGRTNNFWMMTTTSQIQDDFLIANQLDGGGFTIRFYIKPDGNVGIGESNPSAKLDVVGTTELNGDVSISSNLTVDIDTLFVDGTTGKVGIGTTAPANALHVVGGSGPFTNLADGVHIGEDQFGTTRIELVDGNGQTPYIDFLESNTGDTDARIRLVSGDLEVGSQQGELRLQAGTDVLLGTPAIKVTLKQSGNLGIGITNPIHPLEMGSGAHVTAGGVWTDSSDVNRKENISPVDAQEILERVRELPISTWNFKDEDDAIRHIGPMAQDFHAAFGVGADDKHLASLDSSGVALTAIQGL